jgi:hypothetical protein
VLIYNDADKMQQHLEAAAGALDVTVSALPASVLQLARTRLLWVVDPFRWVQCATSLVGLGGSHHGAGIVLGACVYKCALIYAHAQW